MEVITGLYSLCFLLKLIHIMKIYIDIIFSFSILIFAHLFEESIGNVI